MSDYFRPLLQNDPATSVTALRLHGGDLWFDTVEVLSRQDPPVLRPVSGVPDDVLTRFVTPHKPVAGLKTHRPQLMGVINATPDSFSDGGQASAIDAAKMRAREMLDSGVAIIDVGGESTRPGAQTVAIDEEIQRTAPIIEQIRALDAQVAISIDTRKAAVAEAAIAAGASLINDVSAMRFDPDMARFAAGSNVPICLMHAQGDPATMQKNPSYEDVLLDVYDHLSERINAALDAGIARERILIDPGIGFGKTLDHNLRLIRRLGLFHGLGCPIVLGVSRKGFIGTIGRQSAPEKRGPGSVAVALEGLRQGVQIIRAHDIEMHMQAIALWSGLVGHK